MQKLAKLRWEKVMEAWVLHGGPAREFCEEHGIAWRDFLNWWYVLQEYHDWVPRSLLLPHPPEPNDTPTKAIPGSKEKIAVMARRAAEGKSLFAPGDPSRLLQVGERGRKRGKEMFAWKGASLGSPESSSHGDSMSPFESAPM